MKKLGWAAIGALALAAVLALARVIQAGPLDPPGPVGSTMKTIGDLVPSWHQTLASSGCGSPRWSCVMGGAAVLDNETGLVWEKTPAQGASPVSWSDAVKFCGANGTGGRYGWRLPTNEELNSLLDPTGFDVITGSPFTGISTTLGYWSSTTAPGAGFNALATGFGGGFGGSVNKDDAVDFTFWCVRGQHGFDAPAPTDAGAWSKVLTASAPDSCHSPRFTCVFFNQAVLDHETGLVWERNAQSAPADQWGYGTLDCYHNTVGGRSGWRMPTEIELLTLLDTSVTSPSYSLPTGHPFTGVSGEFWWSSSDDGTNGLGVFFRGGTGGVPSGVPGSAGGAPKGSSGNVWCVRAP